MLMYALGISQVCNLQIIGVPAYMQHLPPGEAIFKVIVLRGIRQRSYMARLAGLKLLCRRLEVRFFACSCIFSVPKPLFIVYTQLFGRC